jgi:hypothetical protein
MENRPTCLSEANRHWEQGRAIISMNGKKPTVATIKDCGGDLELVYHKSCVKLKDPKNSLALVTGEFSGFTVVDVDCKPGQNGVEVWNSMVEKHDTDHVLDSAVCSESPSGGLHYYFKYTSELKHGQARLFKSVDGEWADIDVRNSETGGFSKCYPSEGYNWVRSIFEYELTECPQWIIDWHKNSIAKKTKKEPKGEKKINNTTAPNKKEETTDEDISALVDTIPGEHAKNYDSWIKIIMAIYKCFPNDEGLNIADEFSKRGGDAYDPEELRKKWDSFGECDIHSLGIHTLLYYSDMNYDKVKEAFELEAFKIVHPFRYCIERAGYDDLWLYPCKSFEDLHANKYYYSYCSVKKILVKGYFIIKWMGDPQAKTYDELSFDPPPYSPKPGCKNLFTGLEAQKLCTVMKGIPDLIKPILDHIMIMVNHHKESYDYVLNWLAHRVQCPGQRPKVALVFMSLQGSGKGIFWEWFGEKIIGSKYFFSDAGLRDICGNFNVGLKNKILIFLDETNGKETFSSYDKIKRDMDAPYIKINQKNQDVVTLRNCAGWVFASNNDVPVKIESSDRRHFVIKCSDEKRKDMGYFKQLSAEMDKDEVVKAFYDFLKERDISGFSFITDRPETEIYKTMKEASAPADVGFIQYMIDNDLLTDTEEKISGSQLQEVFVLYKEKNNIPKEVLSGNRFGIAMKKWFTKSTPKGKTMYHLNKCEALARLKAEGYEFTEETW